MYIPEFWVGVGCTVLCEIIVGSIFIFSAVHKYRVDEKEKEIGENNSDKNNE